MDNSNDYFERLRTAVFGGYRKKDVLEYVDFLLTETESIRSESNRYKEDQECRIRDLNKELESLKKQLETQLQKEQCWEKEYQEMVKKVDMYEHQSSAVLEFLAEAGAKADHILDEANNKASRMLEEAQNEAQNQRKLAKTVIHKELEVHFSNFTHARTKINDYLITISNLQEGLEKIYVSLNKMAVDMKQLRELEERIITPEAELKDESITGSKDYERG